MTTRHPPSHRTVALALAAALLAVAPALASTERARLAQARGDLRTAQIELRNAVRAAPDAPEKRAALAAVSLDLGDGDTGEKEARAALARGFDPVAGTRLLLRAYLVRSRFEDLLRDFPPRRQPAAVGAQVAAARALAELALGQREDARRSVTEALELAPDAVQPHLAAAALAWAEGDLAAAETAVDRALALDPQAAEALLRKGQLQAERHEAQAAVDTFSRLLDREPGHVLARIHRAEAQLRLGREAEARRDVDAALRTVPNSAPAIYLRAVLLGRARDWRGAEEALQRLGPLLGSFPDGYLLLATAKRALGQTAQAEDAARRHLARRPEDPRGARLLAAIEVAAGRPEEAVAVLGRLAGRGTADAEALAMLGRLHAAAGRPREAAEALRSAATLAPDNAEILARLAIMRFAIGDVAGAIEAARESLQRAPAQPGLREILAVAALSRGEVATAEAELARLSPEARQGEAAGMLHGTIRLLHLDLAGARAAFTEVLRAHPASVNARLGLARVAALEGKPAEAEGLLGEVLRLQPANAMAASRLAAEALSGGPRAASARAVLEAAQAAAPQEPALAVVLARVLLGTGEPARALAVLQAEPLQGRSRGAAVPLLRAEAHAAAGQWSLAEAASRAALAEEPDSLSVRRQLALLLLRGGNTREAEALAREGLRTRPGDAGLQQLLAQVVLRAQGLDAALALAEELAQQPAAQPAAGQLRGDLLAGAGRPAEAAEAYAASYARAPSAVLALRQAAAWQAAGQPAKAVATLNAWLEREPEDAAALGMLAQLDIQAGRLAEAAQRLELVVARQPSDAVSLNNLAWLLDHLGGAKPGDRAQALAERAFFLSPIPAIADTLGWILARRGAPEQAVALLRRAALAGGGAQGPDPALSYRLAFALRAAGQKAEALAALEPALASDAAFPERAEAERLLADLRAER